MGKRILCRMQMNRTGVTKMRLIWAREEEREKEEKNYKEETNMK